MQCVMFKAAVIIIFLTMDHMTNAERITRSEEPTKNYRLTPQFSSVL